MGKAHDHMGSHENGARRNGGHSAGRLRVLDLGCGCGHLAFFLDRLQRRIELVCADLDFTNLYLAKRHLIPTTPCYCVDAEHPLPFADADFAAIFTVDFLHYVRAKRSLVNELARVSAPDSIWLFSHVHNMLGDNYAPGAPLTAGGYERLLERADTRLFPEQRVLDDLMSTHQVNLERTTEREELDRADAFCIVAGMKQGPWMTVASNFQEAVAECELIRVNPIYEVTHKGRLARLRVRWPNESLRRECHLVARYLDEEQELDGELLNRILAGQPGPGLDGIRRELANKLVLVPLPRGYV
jgi:SAM-dependent methyltransferase